jgi:translation initiation factor 1
MQLHILQFESILYGAFMNQNKRLVYSSEDGQIAKTMDTRVSKKKRKTPTQAPSIKNPNKQGVRIRREIKGRGGKNVCVIEGIPLPKTELKNLQKKLQSQLGTGGALKNNCIEIQGDHRERLLELLKEAGFPAKLSGG